MRLSAIAASVLAAVVGGCAVNYTRPVGNPAAPPTPAQRTFESYWQASLDVLNRYGFTADYQNRRTGEITTFPMVGQNFLEFWRRDAATWYRLTENSLQTIYSTAAVTITPSKDNPNDYRVKVDVELTRSDRPDPAIVSTSDAYGLFYQAGGEVPAMGQNPEEKPDREAASPAGAAPAGTSRPATKPATRFETTGKKPFIGHDTDLEKTLTREIVRRASAIQMGGK